MTETAVEHPPQDQQAPQAPPNVVPLDTFRQAAARKNGDLKIPLDEHTTVTLRRPMRLSREERSALRAAEQRGENARKEHPDVIRARRVLKAAEDRRAILAEDTDARVVREHDRRVAEAETARDEAVEANPVDEIAQLDEIIEGIRDLFRAIADTREHAEQLLTAVGDDFYVLQEILSQWRGQAEPGEASPSQT